MKHELPADRVSRNPKIVSECKPVVMAIVRRDDTSISISCGWFKRHARLKVREDAAQRHLDMKHGGQGLWM